MSVSFTTEVPLALAVGGATANVTITSGDIQTQLNNTDQQLSTLLDNKKILDLPLLSRDPNGLILLAPGVTQTQTSLGGFSVNGQRERNNNFLVDESITTTPTSLGSPAVQRHPTSTLLRSFE